MFKNKDIIEKNIKEKCNYCLNVNTQLTCLNYLNCPYQKQCKANVVINDYENIKEIIVFKNNLKT